MNYYNNEDFYEPQDSANNILNKILDLSAELNLQEERLFSSLSMKEKTEEVLPFSPSKPVYNISSPSKPTIHPRSSKFSHSHRQLGSPSGKNIISLSSSNLTPNVPSFSPPTSIATSSSFSPPFLSQSNSISPNKYHETSSPTSSPSSLTHNQLDILKLKNLIEDENDDDESLLNIQEDILTAINQINFTEESIYKESEQRKKFMIQEDNQSFPNSQVLTQNSILNNELFPNNSLNSLNILIPNSFQPPSLTLPYNSINSFGNLEDDIENFNFNDQLLKKMMDDTSTELYETVEECSKMRNIIKNLMVESQSALDNTLAYKIQPVENNPIILDQFEANLMNSPNLDKAFSTDHLYGFKKEMPIKEKENVVSDNEELKIIEKKTKGKNNRKEKEESEISRDSFEILFTSENSDDKIKNEVISKKISKSKKSKMNQIKNQDRLELIPSPPPSLFPSNNQMVKKEQFIPRVIAPLVSSSQVSTTIASPNSTSDTSTNILPPTSKSQFSLTVDDNNKIVLDFNSNLEGHNSHFFGEIISTVVKNMKNNGIPDENKTKVNRKVEISDENDSNSLVTNVPPLSQHQNLSTLSSQIPNQNSIEFQQYLKSINHSPISNISYYKSLYPDNSPDSHFIDVNTNDIYQSIQSTKENLQRASDSLFLSKDPQSVTSNSTNQFTPLKHPTYNKLNLYTHNSTSNMNSLSMTTPSFSSKPQPHSTSLSSNHSSNPIEAPSPVKMLDKVPNSISSIQHNMDTHRDYMINQKFMNNDQFTPPYKSQFNKFNSYSNQNYHNINKDSTNNSSNFFANSNDSHPSSSSLNHKNYHKSNEITSSSSPSIIQNNNVESTEFDNYLRILENLALKERIDQSSQILINNKIKEQQNVIHNLGPEKKLTKTKIKKTKKLKKNPSSTSTSSVSSNSVTTLNPYPFTTKITKRGDEHFIDDVRQYRQDSYKASRKLREQERDQAKFELEYSNRLYK